MINLFIFYLTLDLIRSVQIIQCLKNLKIDEKNLCRCFFAHSLADVVLSLLSVQQQKLSLTHWPPSGKLFISHRLEHTSESRHRLFWQCL